jgi:hypothetical protein
MDNRTRQVITSLVVLGILVRIVCLLGRGSFWMDEASVAVNLRESVAFLVAGELHYEQKAPLGWLLLHKPVYHLFGPSAVALRASSCLAGIAALMLLAWTACRAFKAPAAVIATGIASLSPALILYSVEFKHYSFDFLAGAFMAWFVFVTCTEKCVRKPALYFNLAAMALALVSLPGVFCAATAQLVISVAEKDLQSRVHRFVSVSYWIPIYGVCLYWFATYNSTYSGAELQDFWTFAYMSRMESIRGMLSWPKDWAKQMNEMLLGSATAAFAATGAMIVAVMTCRDRLRWLGLFSVLVILSAVAVSFLALYPPVRRLGLFVLPAFIILVGAGVDWIASHPNRGMLVAWCFSIVICFSTGIFLARSIRRGEVPSVHLGSSVGKVEEISAGVEALRNLEANSHLYLLIPKATMPALAFHFPQGIAEPARIWAEGKAPLNPELDFNRNETFSVRFLAPSFGQSFVAPMWGNYKKDPYVATSELMDFMHQAGREGASVALLATQGYPLYMKIFSELGGPYPPPRVIEFRGGVVLFFEQAEQSPDQPTSVSP